MTPEELKGRKRKCTEEALHAAGSLRVLESRRAVVLESFPAITRYLRQSGYSVDYVVQRVAWTSPNLKVKDVA